MRTARILHGFARPPWPWLFAAAGCGLLLSAGHSGHAQPPVFCGSGPAQLIFAAGWTEGLRIALEFNPPGRLMMDWAIMLLAMMPPLLAVPIMHVWRSSLPRRRGRAIGHFVLGYGAVWMAAGLPLTILALLLQLIAGPAAFAVLLALAVIWSASPWQRIALNRGHRLRRIGLFGRAADRDCLAFGAVHGGWCIASCWLWMMVPLAAGPWHLAAMVAAGAAMLGERLAPPGAPRWRLPAFLALFDRPRAVRNG